MLQSRERHKARTRLSFGLERGTELGQELALVYHQTEIVSGDYITGNAGYTRTDVKTNNVITLSYNQ